MSLHGRDTDLRALIAILLEGRSGVLRGEAGIGKTELWRAALAALAEQGARPEAVVATSTTRLIPGGAFAGLVARLPSDVAPAERMVATLRALAAGGDRFVLGIDDAHLLDDESAAAALQHVLGGGSVLVTVRRHEEAPDAIVRLWKDRLAEVIELGPLSAEATSGLVEELVAAPVDTLTQSRLHAASGGSPLFVRELVAHGRANGALVDLGGVWTWSGELAPGPGVAAVIRARLEHIDPAARAIAELLAVGGSLPAELFETLASETERSAARRAGVIRDRSHGAGRIVELAHPLYAPVLTAGLFAERTQSILVRLAEAAAPLAARDHGLDVLLAAWLTRLADRSRPELLVAAAKRAFDRAELALAERLAHAAVAAGGGVPAERIAARVRTFLGGAGPANPPDGSDAETVLQTAISRADAFFVGFATRDSALDALGRAQRALVAPRADELAALALAIRLHAGDPVGPILAEVQPLVESASPAVAARAAMVAGPALTVAGRPLDAIEALTRGIEAGEAAATFSPALLDLLRSARAQSRLFSGSLREAAAEAAECHARAESAGDEPALAIWSQLLGYLLLWQGRPRTAARHTGEAIALMHGVDLVGNTTWCHANLAASLAWAERSAGDVLPTPPAPGSHGALLAPFVHLALAGRHLCAGQRADAEREVRSAIARADASGHRLSELLAQHHLLRLRPTRACAARIEALAESCQGDLATALAESGSALAKGSAAELERAAQRFAALGLVALASEWFLRAAIVHRQEASPLAARRCGNAAAEQRSHMEADPPLPERTDTDSDPLTPREREVAALAADGLTNHAIAARLGVSVRTVHAHLRTVYDKLGVNDRQRLAAVLLRPLPPPHHDRSGA